MNRHCAGRPVTLALPQSAWTACQQNEKRHERGELINEYIPQQDAQPLSPRELDQMSDAEVDRLYHGSLRAYADSSQRRLPGVLA